MSSLFQDLRFALRTLRRSPGFTAVSVLCVALGVGANTAVFSAVNGLLLRPLPVAEPERIVRLFAAKLDTLSGVATVGEFSGWSYPDLAAVRDRSRVFEALTADERTGFRFSRGGPPAWVQARAVSGTYFQVMGMRARLGRTLLPADDVERAPGMVAVISEAFWRREFAGRADVLGRHVRLDDRDFTVVGVADDAAMGRVLATEVWVPITARAALDRGSNPIDTRSVTFAQIYGRLRPGVSSEEAQAAVSAVMRQLAAEYPQTNRTRAALVQPAGTVLGLEMMPEAQRRTREASRLVLAVTMIVLLIACANVANLLLARATARRRELAVRAALGAGRARLVRQLLLESLVLALLGAAAGLLVAVGGMALLQASVAEVAQLTLALDRRVLGFTAAVAVGAGLAIGLLPALRATQTRMVHDLKEGSVRTGRRRARLQSALVVAQLALALVLLVATGLVVRTLLNLHRVDPGFAAQRLLVAPFSFSRGGSPFDAAAPAEVEALLERIRALPGVAAASAATAFPLGGARMYVTLHASSPEGATTEIRAGYASAHDGFFRTAGIPVLRGQGFDQLAPADTDVVLVNQSMARRYWPGRDPIGTRFGGERGPRVVGVVGDTRNDGLSLPAEPMVYYRFPHEAGSFLMLAVRTAGSPAPLAAPLRRLLATANPAVPAPDVHLARELVAYTTGPTRRIVTFLTLFSVLALTLAAVGLYGVVAYGVAQRTHEIGVRLALGAPRAEIVRLVVRGGAWRAGLGLALGVAGALAATRLLRAALYEVAPTDTLTYALVSLLLAGVALLASWLPARRAARVDPMVALRSE